LTHTSRTKHAFGRLTAVHLRALPLWGAAMWPAWVELNFCADCTQCSTSIIFTAIPAVHLQLRPHWGPECPSLTYVVQFKHEQALLSFPAWFLLGQEYIEHV